jgi:hypothetical protein
MRQSYLKYINFKWGQMVAENLGVSRQTVNDAKDELSNSANLSKIGHDRHLVREYYEETPDASYRAGSCRWRPRATDGGRPGLDRSEPVAVALD